jgi:hypothetical protein
MRKKFFLFFISVTYIYNKEQSPEMYVEEERVSESWQQYQTDGPGHKMLHRVGNGLG